MILQLLFITTLTLVSCGKSPSTPNRLNEDDSKELTSLLETHVSNSDSTSGTRGFHNSRQSFCPAIIVFGDNRSVAGEVCAKWELDVKSSFEPGALVDPTLVYPTIGSRVNLLAPIFLEGTDHVQASSPWAIHASTSTSPAFDGLIFSADAGTVVQVRGTVKSCDGKRTETISQDIQMSSSQRGRQNLLDGKISVRFMVHPSPYLCQSVVPPPDMVCPTVICAQPPQGCTYETSGGTTASGCPQFPCGTLRCS